MSIFLTVGEKWENENEWERIFFLACCHLALTSLFSWLEIFFFSLQLSMNWNESVILFIGFWIDYYQNNSASIWEKVGLHRVHTLRVLSEQFFFLITAGILRSSVADRKLKIEDSTWQVCGGLVPF